jgi:hypothetical protein
MFAQNKTDLQDQFNPNAPDQSRQTNPYYPFRLPNFMPTDVFVGGGVEP